MSELAITVTCQSCYFSNSVSTSNAELDTLPSLLILLLLILRLKVLFPMAHFVGDTSETG